jgi:hypothetical protein
LKKLITLAKRMRKLRSALGFALPYVLVAAGAGVGLSEEIPLPGRIGAVTLNVLLPVKAGVVGVMAAALLAFWGFFWAEVIGPQTPLGTVPAVVRSYRRAFAYIVSALLLLFVSMGADFYLYLVNQKSRSVLAISFGCFAASLFMLLGFIIDFSVRTLVQMDALKKAGELAAGSLSQPVVDLAPVSPSTTDSPPATHQKPDPGVPGDAESGED